MSFLKWRDKGAAKLIILAIKLTAQKAEEHQPLLGANPFVTAVIWKDLVLVLSGVGTKIYIFTIVQL